MPAHPPTSEVSLLVIEAGLTAVAVAISLLYPALGGRFFSHLEQYLSRVARNRRLAIAITGISACGIRLALLPIFPIPHPFIHDEFSHLLAADTFASGRLTNPTHPMWVHFETFHVDQLPTYMSMYFPAQGLVLAAGQRLLGNPWYGVLISVGAMCSALTWMLQGWIRPTWAFYGGMLAVLRVALFSYWGNSYWGGAVPALGGALVLGAFPRLLRAPTPVHAATMAAGSIILVNSRPYEGLLVCVPVALVLLVQLRKRICLASLVRLLAPAGALLLSAVLLMGVYNYRVFGSAFTVPYELNRARYASAPHFVWQSPRPQPHYRNAAMREFYAKLELTEFLEARTAEGFSLGIVKRTAVTALFFVGITLIPALVVLPSVFRMRRMRLVSTLSLIFAVGICLEAFFFPHYVAPFACILYLILLRCLIRVRLWTTHGKACGLALVRTSAAVCVVLAGLRIAASPLNIEVQRWPATWYGTPPLGLDRAQVEAKLKSYPGRQLALVRYSPTHTPLDEWVYNAAEIDNSKVVWARDMTPAENAELLHYFADRTVWLVQPDCVPVRVSRYEETENNGAVTLPPVRAGLKYESAMEGTQK
jgi:hypothetical protein